MTCLLGLLLVVADPMTPSELQTCFLFKWYDLCVLGATRYKTYKTILNPIIANHQCFILHFAIHFVQCLYCLLRPNPGVGLAPGAAARKKTCTATDSSWGFSQPKVGSGKRNTGIIYIYNIIYIYRYSIYIYIILICIELIYHIWLYVLFTYTCLGQVPSDGRSRS